MYKQNCTLSNIQSNGNLVSKKSCLSKATLLTLLATGITACATEPKQPDVVVVPTPQATVTVTATPQVTTTVVVTPTPQPTTIVQTQPITDVLVITNANKQTLVNRPVQFTNVNVQSVVGDRTFWVGSSNAQRVFVVLAPNLDAGSAENKVVVKAGQTLDLAGVLKLVPSVKQAQQQWKGLTATEAQGLKNQVIYLEASQIRFKPSTQ
ncbi:hypothetical protein NIES37_47560 [Tolypothrix tenuis PCC 7101]|uniref:Lipoprotein n=1 Tax=Tolypothrix tenuis PCC 7101 TaxID=231146 RepID=A0A1Z4N4T7_9CYAN|nr:hypothetical protein [Aulosira sp. FACHB-113]BAZ00760.1 hypothetical protein NIES37_47560 [Tolypothrix tenuis PCC 7101]BAZ75317.1 hypothetical protein NIES50_38990 [Aulosira laxa NIES-50]